MNRKQFSEAMNELDDRYIEKAIQYDSKKQPTTGKKSAPWLKWVTAAACVALIFSVAGLFTPVSPGFAVSAYSYGSEEKITESGAIMSTGTINDDGEMTGHPLMFFLAGENIETVRFSCKNQILNFVDLTEKRDGYGNAQNFTVPYGEDPNEYYFLLIDWIPTFTIRELSKGENDTISSLSEELRTDIIVMEITFANGSTATKAIQISLQNDGTFFATFQDYTITETDTFVDRPDSPARPEPETEQETPEITVTFRDENGDPVMSDAGWYNFAGIHDILVQWNVGTPSMVQLYYTPAGSETADQIRLIHTKMALDGDTEIIFLVSEIEIPGFEHMHFELDYGSMKVTQDPINIFYDEETWEQQKEWESMEAAGLLEETEPVTSNFISNTSLLFSVINDYWEAKGYYVESMSLYELTQDMAKISVLLSKNGVIQDSELEMTWFPNYALCTWEPENDPTP